jgi:hypothetical protein
LFAVIFQVPAQAQTFRTGCNYNIDAVASAFITLANSPTGIPEVNNDQKGDSNGPSGFDTSTLTIACAGFGGSVNSSAVDSIPAGPGQIATFSQDASAQVAGSVVPGRISLSLSTTATSTPQAYFFLDQNGDPFAVNNGEIAGGETNASAGSTEFFTINGPANTNVTLQFNPTFDGSFVGGVTARNIIGIFDSAGTPPIVFNGPGNQTVNISAMTGQTIEVTDNVSLTANSCAGGPYMRAAIYR